MLSILFGVLFCATVFFSLTSLSSICILQWIWCANTIWCTRAWFRIHCQLKTKKPIQCAYSFTYLSFLSIVCGRDFGEYSILLHTVHTFYLNRACIYARTIVRIHKHMYTFTFIRLSTLKLLFIFSKMELTVAVANASKQALAQLVCSNTNVHLNTVIDLLNPTQSYHLLGQFMYGILPDVTCVLKIGI